MGKRAIKDEQERISSRAKLELSKEFLDNLRQDIEQKMENIDGVHRGAPLPEMVSEICSNLSLYHSIVSKSLDVQHSVFNVRHEIQFLVSEVLERAESQHIQIETSLSPSLPMRLKGDPERFGQIVQALLKVMLDDTKAAAVILEVQFLREFETAGELYVTVRKIRDKSGIQFFSETVTEEQPQSLDLTIAKALAELMNGEVEVLTAQNGENYIQFNARLDIADQTGQMDFHKDRFRGERILLVGSNPAIVDIKRQELEALGFATSVETAFKRVKSTLVRQLDSGTPIENMLIFHQPDDADCSSLLQSLREAEQLRFVNKVISVSANSQKDLMKEGYLADLGFYYVAKPTGLFELESTFEFILSSKGNDEALSKMRSGTIIVAGEADDIDGVALDCNRLVSQKVVSVSKDKLLKALEEAFNPMVVVPCGKQERAAEIVKVIRQYEDTDNKSASFIPIIGVGEGLSEREVAAFEIGLDDYIDLASQRSKTLTSMLRYWRSLEL